MRNNLSTQNDGVINSLLYYHERIIHQNYHLESIDKIGYNILNNFCGGVNNGSCRAENKRYAYA
jgi:hypothetical protein